MNEGTEIPDIPGYISIKEAAKMLGLADRTVYEYVSEGRIRAVRAADVLMIPIDEVRNFKPNTAGRPRTNIPQWRISPTDNALQYTSIHIHIQEGKLDDFRKKLDEIRKRKDHLFPGTISRYVLSSNKAPEHVEIMLIWRISVMPDDPTRQMFLQAFKQELEDCVDWTTAQFDDGSVFMHA